MIARSFTIDVPTRGDDDIVDVTDRVQDAVRDSGVRTGQVTIMVVGSTAALSTLEYEPGLVRHDIAAALERVAPRGGRYRHEETWHDDNGHSHVRSNLVGTSLALPVVDGRIPLGTWQQLVLMDFDTRPRRRRLVMTVLGVAEDGAE